MISKTRPILVLLALGLLFEGARGLLESRSASEAAGAVLFVNGSDGTCGGNAPCFSTIQDAVDAVQAGEIVRIQAGTYQETVAIVNKNNTGVATELDRIVIEGDPAAQQGTVVIEGPGVDCTATFAIRFKSSHFVTVRNLTIRSAAGKAFFIPGGNRTSEATVIDRNRIFGNRCGPAILIKDGNANTVISNNLIYDSDASAIDLQGMGGPHYVVGNTIDGNEQSGIIMSGGIHASLVNNSVTHNNASASGPGRGIRRRGNGTEDPTFVVLKNNLVCGNTGGELGGALLDAGDSGNRTPTGSEGLGVIASPGCEVEATVYRDVDGTDNTGGSGDDDYFSADGSPIIDGGANAKQLVGGIQAYKKIVGKDFANKPRPKDGDGNGSKKFDIGAYERPAPTPTPTVTSTSTPTATPTPSPTPDVTPTPAPPTPTPTPEPTPTGTVGPTATPTPVIPTLLTTESVASGGVCGSLTVNAVGEGVPKRRDPSDPLTDPNDACTGVGTPKACCEDVDKGHCDEGTSIVCGSLTFGGGGGSVGNPGAESVNSGGARTRYSLSCSSAADTACTIGGNAGDIGNGINCSTTGCGGVTPIDTTSPVKVCAINTLGANASGTLNLTSGEISLQTNTKATVYILTATSFVGTACPRCRVGGSSLGTCSISAQPCGSTDDCDAGGGTCSVNHPEAFASGGLPGQGVCDDDSTNAGASCFVFEPAGPTAGLTTDCVPDTSGGGSGVISISTTQSTAGASVSDPAGHFCAGQAGNTDCTFGNASCTGAGAPQACCTGTGMGSCVGQPNICCTGAGMGSCNNFNGCFGSANAGGAKFTDTPGICTGISVTGLAPGALTVGVESPTTTYGAVACIPAVAAGNVLSGLVNNNAGLPGPVVTSSKVTFLVE